MLYGFCILLGAAALVLTYANSGQAALLLLVLMLVAFVFLRSLGYVRFDQMPASAADRKRNRAMRAALQPLGRRLKQLRTRGRDVAARARGGQGSGRGCGRSAARFASVAGAAARGVQPRNRGG